MKTSDFYYDLPKELIAQDPLEDRSSSRLLHLSMKDGSMEHRHFTDILDYLNEGDCLVINDTRVIPARLYGHKEETGALIEILLLKRRENDIWECLVKPGKKARPGAKITFGDGILKGEIIDIVDEGNRLIQFHYDGIFEEILDQLGEMPLPPYITHKLKDKNRYQTVYAKNDGSAAAPTAGLHFTKELLEQAIAEEGATEENQARREIWDARYSMKSDLGGQADGYLKFWMTIEFNRTSGNRWFTSKGARKGLQKELDQVHFHELAAKSELHRELIYRECEHLVKLYMDLCQTDKSYNTILCGLVTMKRDDVKSKLQRDIYETAVKVPRELDMEQELALLTRAARKVYEDYFPGEGGLPE